MKKLLILALSILLYSCTNQEESVETTKPLNILVLGNSITACPAGGEWTGTWGMAATSPEKDFCGVIKNTLNAKVDRKNIAVWENNLNYDLTHFETVSSKSYDYIIVKVGENVSDVANFKAQLKKMIDFYSNYGQNIILVTTVWSQYEFDSLGTPHEVPSDKDRIIREVALENSYKLVDISDMKNNGSMFAWNEYTDSNIGSHPSNFGHLFIANKIIETINH